jgi:plasmid stabilization system protein ParE
MTFQLVVPNRVEDEIRRIDAWWRRHRLAAPDLFVEELAAALELLASAPHAGRKYDHPSVSDVRRVILRATRYHVYYKIHSREVFVLALWSALRGTGPRLQ